MSQAALTIGSRGSDLALYQANFIKKVLVEEHKCLVDIKIIKTTGDKIDHLSFDKMEGKGFFTKELEEALLANEIDLAVHSLKDLMTSQPTGLKLGAAGYRADRREMLLVKKEAFEPGNVIPVKEGGRIGTSSARRQCQIVWHNDSLKIEDLRGNVPTRIKKLRDGAYDAIIIAAAGVTRLELDTSDLEVILLDDKQFYPAPAQGILGIQIREDDERVESVISKLGSKEALNEASLERGLLAKFDSGCTLPLGVHSEITNGSYKLSAVLGVREGDGWAGLKKSVITGTDISSVVSDSFDSLNRGGGMLRLAITRPVDRLVEITRQAAERDIKIVSLPITKSLPLSFDWPAALDPKSIDWLLFTSAEGVNSFFARLSQLNIQIPKETKVGVVGSKTGEAIRKSGREPELVSDRGTGERLFEQLSAIPNLASSTIVYARASRVVYDPEQLLNEIGTDYYPVICYETIAEKIDGKELEEMSDQDYILFTAPSNVNAFSEQFGRPVPQTIAIGSTTARAMKESGWDVTKIMTDANVNSVLEYI